MARGFFSGVIAGTLVSAVGLGGASVLVGPPERSAPEAGAVEVPAGSEFNQSRDDEAVERPESEGVVEPPALTGVTAPEPDDLASLDGADTEPAAQPEAGGAESALGAAPEGAQASGVQVDSEAPVLPSPQTAAPEAPQSEEELSISTDPAQPALPEVTEQSAFPEEELAEAESAPDVPAEPVQPVQPVEPEDPVEPVVESEAPAPAEQETALLTQEEEAVPAEPNVAETAEEEGASSTFGNLAPDVETNRLPSVGDPPEQEAAPESEEAVDAPATADDAELPPLVRFAAEFENPEAKPLMSIVLIDDGTSPVGLQALESFPYPVTFAIPANRADAEDAMAIYRAAGFEVMAMVDLPEGAGPQDTEVAMQSIFGRLPEAVAVMEGTGSGLQASRAATEQLAPILLDSGHGAVFFPKGLNTAQQLLAREGVPAVAVFRDFDASGQNATVIRRFLDQAAFKASQEDAGVVMLGRLRPDTVSALLLWGLQDRASRVALAPISAMLRGE